MKVRILKNADELGREAAALASQVLRKRISDSGKARLVLSTGASQFETLEALITLDDMDWSKVEMFHLDEYVGLSSRHPASFRKYLKERFVDLVPIHKAHFVNGEGSLQEHIADLTREIRKEPIDLALIGIGENAHVAFNDPPANFDTKESYIVVDLDESCKRQQVREGWFDSLDEVPKQAITMTVHQIMQSEVIISSVPHKVKARAIRDFFANDVNNQVPATILKTHPNYTLFLDEQSASEADRTLISSITGGQR
ncbi:glucosamine-6-phosphate deaminase [Paenibacillus filicis]|uniref:Glucosamine-6-phosphate deaminase n=1 Tax=Paenibacillus gyeongsangnamensis TaxID=3388067 RepID=A0ABT4QDP2_9BACL|nr:glucosamine-6-phosphate deaminase [Paenibacillus filicis]MCZ8515003.1 glucosamine-6-phosphate deaminase [Paenibacillus filicis]